MKENAIIYVRKSIRKDDEFSILAQLNACRKYAENNFEIVKEFKEMKTGFKAFEREEFYRMVEFVKKTKIDHLLIYLADRVSRNIEDFVMLKIAVRESEIYDENKDIYLRIHKVNDGTSFRLNHPDDYEEACRTEQDIIEGYKYSARLRQRVKGAIKEKVERGEYPSMAPVGYINNVVTHKIEVDPKRAEKVRKLFQLYATGNFNKYTITKEVRKMGLTRKRRNKQTGQIEDGRPLSMAEIMMILKNPFFKGEFYWGKKLWSNKGINNDLEPTYKPIISEELFDDVQQVLSGKRVNKKGNYNGKNFLFKGVLSCEKCGWSYIGETKGRENKKGEFVEYTYYHCSGQNREGYKHKVPWIKEDVVKELVILNLSTFIDANKEALNHIKKKLGENIEVVQQSSKEAKRALKEQKTKLEIKQEEIYEDFKRGVVTETIYRRMLDRTEEELETINTELSRLQEESTDFIAEGLRCIELCNDVKTKYLKADQNGRNYLLKMMSRTITVKDNNGVTELEFHWNEPFKAIYDKEFKEEMEAFHQYDEDRLDLLD